ncbi:unnamed protein product [Arabidopsis thaliana]|uniref:(thale cress) hypothetical protein n=1 Tax=Arabidopsis thaliana TaxID=3702 RepID=A0A7G2EY38_ARATH|nr:unnamed protein product [Arabidopsis thaliana]
MIYKDICVKVVEEPRFLWGIEILCLRESSLNRQIRIHQREICVND